MSEKDRNLLFEVVHVLEVIIEHCHLETRHAFNPLIDSAEFITRAMDRDDEWFSRLRIVARHWIMLGEFFESVCATNRTEFFVAEARSVVKVQGLLEMCERIHQEIANRETCRPAARS